MKPEDIDFYAIRSIGGDDSWKTNFRGKDGQAILAQVTRRVPELARESGITPQEVGTAGAERKALSATLRNIENRSAAVELFSNKLTKDMASLDKLLDKAAPDGPLFLNKPINILRRQFNDPALAQLDLQARQVGTEYERLITSGGLSQAQLHRGAQEDAKGLISGDFPPERTRAVMKQIQVDIDNAKSATSDARDGLKSRLNSLGATGDNKGPEPGTVQDGYRFKGGDPAKKENWEKV
jgi:hypothetical protein